MSKAVRMHAYGGPDVLQWEDVPLPDPGPGEALVKHEAIGLNYIDVYFRTGLYKVPGFPPSSARRAQASSAPWGRMLLPSPWATASPTPGRSALTATNRVIAADRLIPVPDAISSDVAASVLLQGLTAHYLIHRTYPVKPGSTILVHAAAGGVGLLLCQWAKHLGATVIGVVSTEAKAELARQNGAAHVVVGTQGLPAEVKRLTGGRMVPVVYDSVGRDTFQTSLDCLAPLGPDGELRQRLRPGSPLWTSPC